MLWIGIEQGALPLHENSKLRLQHTVVYKAPRAAAISPFMSLL